MASSAAGSGCGNGSATARRKRSRSASMVMKLALVFGDAVGGDVPAATVAGGGFLVAGVAVQRPAVEELFQPVAVVRRQLAGIARQRRHRAAAVAVARVELFQERPEVVVHAPANRPRAVAERAGDLHMIGDGLAD